MYDRDITHVKYGRQLRQEKTVLKRKFLGRKRTKKKKKKNEKTDKYEIRSDQDLERLSGEKKILFRITIRLARMLRSDSRVCTKIGVSWTETTRKAR